MRSATAKTVAVEPSVDERLEIALANLERKIPGIVRPMPKAIAHAPREAGRAA
jgi:hypothetical protein